MRAWAWLDSDPAPAHTGPLMGLPVGVKDVIDVAGMPTGFGCPGIPPQVARADADCVARLRAAGAVILGKTVTAEFATYSPGPTRNPLNPEHTPGGSSSGSAAAVADGQVAVALGTQTAGSVIRPASFCGVLGFKPTFGRYDTAGVLETSAHLDTVGLFARTIDDLLAVDAVLADDSAMPQPAKALRIGICRTGQWVHASAAMQMALQACAARLAASGHMVVDTPLPAQFDELFAAQTLIHKREAAFHLGHFRRDHADQVSAVFRDFVDAGAAVADADYQAALALQRRCKASEAELFDSCDLLLTPGATGAAPVGLAATGDPAFNRIWTALGTPCLGFPSGATDNGLPLGLQLVGRSGHDRQLLVQAARLITREEKTP